MKNLIHFVLTFVLTIVSIMTMAQNLQISQIKEPDFPFEPMYLENNVKQVPLPMEQFGLEMMNKMGNIYFNCLINSPKSILHLNTIDTIKLVVKHGPIDGPITNVKDIYKLFKMTTNSKKRICLFRSIRKMVDTDEQGLPIIFKKVKDDVYLLLLKDLAPGEYIIKVNFFVQPKVYSFSVN